MENNILSVMMARSSYRGSYQSTPVPRDALRSIMQAGMAAPSGCNMQATRFIAVDDPALLAQIAQSVPKTPFRTAPAVIAVLTEPVISFRNKTFHVQDYAAAIQNMLLQIKALGYESCWYEGHVTCGEGVAQTVENLLGVPEHLHLICLLPVGIAAQDLTHCEKKAFEERAWFNGYQK